MLQHVVVSVSNTATIDNGILHNLSQLAFCTFTVAEHRICTFCASDLKHNHVCTYLPSGAEDDEWDDEWDDIKSTGGYAESESGDSGAIQRGGAHASMKISLNK